MTKCLADVLDHLHFVVATYQFVGKDEDELSFNKGDIVVISKVVDGGWWEGTLDGKFGWFPSNYVKDISSDVESDFGNRQPKKSSSPRTDTAKSYHDQVLKNIVDTERAHGKDLQNFLEKYIEPLKKSTIMSPSQVNSLCGNYDKIVTFHQNLLRELEEEVEYSLEDQRIGACFLRNAMEMKNLYLDYCAGHPQAAELLSQFSEELNDFMEKEGAPSPGIMTLTTYLSKPFVHVEKYASQLKELERYIEEDHKDFLDIKKEAQVYQIIALSCNEVRKRKEMELEMLTGSIEGWEGEPITSLGRIVLMSQVFLEKNGAERKERYFCLFPKDLVVLFVSPKLEGYCFEERIPIADLSGKDLEDTDDFFNAFELTVNEDVWKVMTSSPREKDCWVDALQRMLETRFVTNEPPRPKVVVNLDRSDSKRGQVQSLPKCGTEPAEPIVRSYSTGSSGPVNRPSFRSRATGLSSSESTPAKSSVSGSRSLARGVSPFYLEVKEQPTRKNWSFTRLRPTPPYQPNFTLKTGEDFISSPRTIRRLVTSKKNNKGPEVRSKSEDEVDAYPPKKESRTGLSDSTSILQEDMMILSVIEAYCFSAKQRQTMHCGSPTSIPLPPEVPPHFSFKPVTPPRPHRGKYKKSKKKKPSVDMSNEVSSLRDQVQNLQRQTLYLRENLEQERQARKRFEKLLRKTIRKIAPDVAWHEDPGKTTSV